METVLNAQQPPAAPAVGVLGQAIGTKLYPGLASETLNGLTSNDENAVNRAFGPSWQPR
jgi:hypothetical protein